VEKGGQTAVVDSWGIFPIALSTLWASHFGATLFANLFKFSQLQMKVNAFVHCSSKGMLFISQRS